MTSMDLMRHLAFYGLGWKDIHATNVINVDNDGARLRSFLKGLIIHNLKYFARRIFNAIKKPKIGR